MGLDKLFELLDGLLGESATFQGLTYTLDHGVAVIDFVEEVEFEGELVSGFLLSYLPYLDIEPMYSEFALDVEGLKYLLTEYVL